MVQKLNEEEFKNIIKLSNKSLICFGATWCGKCTMAKQKFPDYEKALNSSVSIYHVDADECPNIFNEYNVDHMPIFILFENGKELKRRSALATTDGIIEFCK